MKLLMTADAVGGVWTYAVDLCAALAEHDVEVVLATMGPRPNAAQRADAQALRNVSLVESDFRLEWMAEPWNDVAVAGDWLLDLAASNAVDLVHLNGYSHAALPWARPVVSVAHSCVVTWWQAVHGCEPPAEWDEYRRRVADGLNSADTVIAPTTAFLKQLRATYSFRRPARVIRNGRLLTASGCETQREPIVLACGRPWDVSKNMRLLDAASQRASWRAYAIGSTSGPDGQTFSASAVQALGTLPNDEVETWMRRAAVFVHPALYEPFGLVVLEAAGAGCALVLADIPTLRELWEGAAELFDPRDSRSLRTRLDGLFADPERQKELGRAAGQRANQYSIDSAAAQYVDLYRTLIREHASRRRAVA